jgi:hypothetical protein
MGKMGQPTDRDAMEAKRIMAVRLLNQGIAPSVVRQQLRVSKTWIYKIRQESMSRSAAWDGVERRISPPRRSGFDRRTDPTRQVAYGMPGERRSGKDRRVASLSEADPDLASA